jgi:hypothetical protein
MTATKWWFVYVFYLKQEDVSGDDLDMSKIASSYILPVS